LIFDPVLHRCILRIVKSAVVTELELSNCLMPYPNSPFFKHLVLKTLKK
jgi:hypothetical protein